MPSASTSNLDALFKIRYPNGIAYQGVKASKFYQLAKKSTDFTGKSREVKVSLSPGTGGSSDFSKALANRGPATHVTFTVTRRKDYVIGSLENEAIKASQGDKAAILAALTSETDLKGKEFGMRVQRRLMSGAGGSLGRVAASGGISTNTIVLSDYQDGRNFYEGLVCQLASDDGTGTSPSANRTGTITVSKVAYGLDVSGTKTTTITFTANVTTGIPAAAASDYIFADGDYGQAPNGVFGWIPYTDPTGSFLGVDRTRNVHATAGFRANEAGKDLIEAFNNGSALGFPFGAEGEYGFVGGLTMSKLQNTLAGRAITRDVKGMADTSFKGLVVYTTYGEVTVLPEPYMPDAKILITPMDCWTILSLGDLPHYSDTGHGQLQQESTDDARQFRLVGYWNLICENPANCTLISI